MKTKKKSSEDLLSRLFFNVLPVQVMIFAMGSINSIVDGAMAGRFIGAFAVGIIGLYYSFVCILQAIGSVLLGGTAVLCGRYMGKGLLDKTSGIFTLNMTVTFLAGALITVISLVFTAPIAAVLGANEALKEGLMTYIRGYAFGILPMLLAQQIAAFLQLERQNLRGYLGIAGMIISNVAMDILFVAVWDMGVWGLALATTFSNFVYFLILVPYYFTSKAQLRFRLKEALWEDLGSLIKTGIPGALLVFCIALRNMVINRILIKYAGSDGLSAMSSFSMVSGVFIAFCLGNGAIVRMLVSVFVGEEDKAAMKKIVGVVMTKGLALSAVVAAIVAIASPALAGVFFADRASDVYRLTFQLFMIYAFCIPLILICQVLTNYLQATGHMMFVNIQSVFDGFFSMVIPAAILAPVMGAPGVWLANPIGIVLTILTVPVYILIYWKRIPKTIDEVFLLKPGFGARPEDCYARQIGRLPEVTECSEEIQDFCLRHGMNKKSSYYSALCMEEIAGYIVQHGFTSDRKKHSADIRAVYSNGDVLLRIKDDCKPFDPYEMSQMVGDEPGESFGIKMVYDIADDVSYRNILGLNVLTITIKEERLKGH